MGMHVARQLRQARRDKAAIRYSSTMTLQVEQVPAAETLWLACACFTLILRSFPPMITSNMAAR